MSAIATAEIIFTNRHHNILLLVFIAFCPVLSINSSQLFTIKRCNVIVTFYQINSESVLTNDMSKTVEGVTCRDLFHSIRVAAKAVIVKRFVQFGLSQLK